MITYIPIIASCVSMVGSIVAIVFALKGGHKSSVQEIEQRAEANAIMNMKLDNIINTTSDINKKIEKIDDNVQKHNEKIIEHEASLKSLHKRIDAMEGKLQR